MEETIQQQILREVSAWPGVTTAPHRFGGIEVRLGRRERAVCMEADWPISHFLYASGSSSLPKGRLNHTTCFRNPDG